MEHTVLSMPLRELRIRATDNDLLIIEADSFIPDEPMIQTVIDRGTLANLLTDYVPLLVSLRRITMLMRREQQASAAREPAPQAKARQEPELPPPFPTEKPAAKEAPKTSRYKDLE